MKLSVVTTLYQSAPYLNEFYKRILKSALSITSDFEIIFVDDGSPDNSLNLAKKFLKDKHRIKVVALSRNYQHHPAIMTGLKHASGDYVFLIDCDLEESPEMLGKLYKKIKEDAKKDPIDVVYASRQVRRGGILEKITGTSFYYIFNFFSPVKVPTNWMIARLMTRRYVRALLQHHEIELFLGGVMVLTGFRQVGIPDEKGHKGATAYSLSKKLSSTTSALTSFSNKPLTFIFLIGSFFSLLALCVAIYLFISYVFFKVKYLSGWTSVLIGIMFFSGLNLAALGVIGIYVGRVFIETKKRPIIIKDIYSNYSSKEN